LLIIAARLGENDIIDELLNDDFDVDYVSDDGSNAIDKAWEIFSNLNDTTIQKKYDNIILSLLKSNCKFPKYFVCNLSKLSVNLVNFVQLCENLHILVDQNRLNDLKLLLESEPNLCYFYNKDNKSLMAHAISSGHADIWHALIPYGLDVGKHEIGSLGNLYSKYSQEVLKVIRVQHQTYAKEQPSAHVLLLLACSQIGSNDRKFQNHWGLIHEAFQFLDTKPEINFICKKILQIAAKWKRLTIYFDLKHDTTYYLDPIAQLGTKGVIYPPHTIYIGAKGLLDNSEKYKTYGTLVHELCHLAIYVTYFNNCKPYPVGDSLDKMRYEADVVPECATKGYLDEYLIGSISNYPDAQKHAEYIVRAVHMLVHYELYSDLQQRLGQFPNLFKYFEDIVVKEFDKLLEIISIILDKNDVKYNQLTVPMQAKILHSSINYQGQNFIIKNVTNPNILNDILTPIDIHSRLYFDQSSKCLENSTENITEHSKLPERKFTLLNTPRDSEGKTFSQIQDEMNTSEIFLLSDKAGAGKTTIFEILTESLKEKFKDSWVCLIKLRDHRDVFNSFREKKEEINKKNVLDMLIKIQNLKSDNKPTLESECFRILFKKRKLIILLDGVDEVSPQYSDTVIKILKVLHAINNKILVSSRPQCASKIEKELKMCKAYRLVPFTSDERIELIKQINKNYESKTSKTESVVVEKLNEFFIKVEEMSWGDFEVNNPLMIKIIVELYIEGDINLDEEFLNLYSIFEKATDKLKEEISKKIDSKDNDAFSKFNLGDVHEVLALKYLVEYIFVKNLSIIKKWKRERKNWPVDKIQRFGFVTLDPEFFFNPRDDYIDFIHRTYAEFFVARFIKSIFFDGGMLSDTNDFKYCVKILMILEERSDNLVSNFLFGDTKANKSSRFSKEGVETVLYMLHELMTRSKNSIHDEQYEKVKFLLNLLSNNPEFTKKIWNFIPNFRRDFLSNPSFNPSQTYNIFSYIKDKNVKLLSEHYENSDLESESAEKIIELCESFSLSDRLLIYRNCITYFEDKSDIRQSLIENCLNKYFVMSEIEEENFKLFFKTVILCTEEIEEFLNLKTKIQNLLDVCNKKSPRTLFNIYCFSMYVGETKFDDNYIENIHFQKEFFTVFSEHKIPIVVAMKLKTEDIETLSKILLKISTLQKLDLIQLFSFSDGLLRQIIKDDDEFTKLKDFFSILNCVDLKREIIIRRLFDETSNDNNLLVFMFKNGIKCFERISFFYENDDEFQEILQDIFWTSNYFEEILMYMTDEIFPKFKTIIENIFESNPKNLKHFIEHVEKNNVGYGKKFSYYLDKFKGEKVESESQKKLNSLLNNYLESCQIDDLSKFVELYSNTSNNFNEEFQNSLEPHLVTLIIISTEVSIIKLIQIAKKVFNTNKLNLFKCLQDEVYFFLTSKFIFHKLIIFLDGVLEVDERKDFCEKLICESSFNIKKFNLKGVTFLRNLNKFISYFNLKFEKGKKLVETKFSSGTKLIEIYGNPKYSGSKIMRAEFVKFISTLFGSDKKSLIDFVTRDLFEDKLYYLKHVEDLKQYESFLLNALRNEDKNLVGEVMQKFWFHENSSEECDYDCIYVDFVVNEKNELYDKFICKDHFTLPAIFYYKDTNSIKILTDLIKKYKLSWEFAQNLFIKKFPFEAIQGMSSDDYKIFESFLKLVFKGNENKLRKFIRRKYKNDEIFNNNYATCERFVYAFKLSCEKNLDYDPPDHDTNSDSDF